MSAFYALGERVLIVEKGDFLGMVGTIVDRRPSGDIMATGFGKVQWQFVVKFENGQKQRFFEQSIAPYTSTNT